MPPLPPPLHLAESSTTHPSSRTTYTRGTRPSSSLPPVALATFSWTVPSPHPRPRVLLSHGFRSHTRFNFLTSSPTHLHAFAPPGASSFVRDLVLAGFDVHAHDHYGHGASGGLRAWFPSFDVLVADVLSHARDLRAGRPSHAAPWAGETLPRAAAPAPAPVFVVGHSMGGGVCILACLEDAAAFDGMCLSSAAAEAPPHMAGLYGRALEAAGAVASVVLSTWALMPVERNKDAAMQALFESDAGNSMVRIRGRVGGEFMRMYREIKARAPQITTPFLAMSGGRDTLVNPEASRRFYDAARSKDKELNVREDMWHNLLTEPGKEENWRLYIDWLVMRLPNDVDDH